MLYRTKKKQMTIRKDRGKDELNYKLNNHNKNFTLLICSIELLLI